MKNNDSLPSFPLFPLIKQFSPSLSAYFYVYLHVSFSRLYYYFLIIQVRDSLMSFHQNRRFNSLSFFYPHHTDPILRAELNCNLGYLRIQCLYYHGHYSQFTTTVVVIMFQASEYLNPSAPQRQLLIHLLEAQDLPSTTIYTEVLFPGMCIHQDYPCNATFLFKC